MARSRRRDGRGDEPEHRPPRGAGARERQRLQPEPPRLSLRDRRPRARCPSSAAPPRRRPPSGRAPCACTRRRPRDYEPAAADGFDSAAHRLRRDHGAVADPAPLPVPRPGYRRPCCTPAAAAGSAASSSACTCSSARASTGCGSSRVASTASTRTGGRVRAVVVTGAGGAQTIGTERAVLAAGPYLQRAGRLLGVDLPVFCELHAKIAWNDALGAVPRDAPLTIWTDPVTLSLDRRRSAPSSRPRRGARPAARRAAPGRPRPARGRGRQHLRPRDLDLRHGARGARPSPRASTPRIPRSSCTGWRA